MASLLATLLPRPSVVCLFLPHRNTHIQLVAVEALRPLTTINSVDCLDTEIWVTKKVGVLRYTPA